MRSLPFTTLALALTLGSGAVSAAQPPDNPIVAIVNGNEIHRSDLDAAQQHLPEQYRQIPLQMIYDPLLEQVISNRLLVAAANKEKLQDKPDVQAEIARARDDVLRNSLLQKAIRDGASDDKLKAAYEASKHQPGFAQEEVHAQHILVASEAEARDVIAELGKGADFAELAKGKSTDPTAKENAGDLGYFKRDAMVPEFADAAFKMDPGTTAKDPVQTQFGWHVIKVVDRRTAVPTFEEKETELREQLSREIVDKVVAQAHGDAQVQRFNIDGSPKTDAPKAQ